MFRGIQAAQNAERRNLGARRVAARARGGLTDADVKFIDEVWAKYDVDDDGGLGVSEVKQLMTDMNEGVPPSDKEVKILVKISDVDNSGLVSKTELRKLVATWFVTAENKNRKLNFTNVKREVKQAFSGCIHSDHTEPSIMVCPGEEAVKFWQKTQMTMEANYKKQEPVT
jgi:hypothetical protein